MNDQTPSGNRWEPTGPEGQAPTEGEPAAPAAPSAPTASTAPTAPEPPDAEDAAYAAPTAGRRSRLGTLLARPGRAAWLAGLAAALVVLAGAGGFLAGHATAEGHDDPARIGRDWQHPGAPFDSGHDGDGDHGFPPPQDGSGGDTQNSDTENSGAITGSPITGSTGHAA